MRRLLKRALKERFVVTLDTGEAFNGLLIAADSESIELADVTYHPKNADSVKVDGSIYLERPRVLYLQKP